VTPQLSGCFQHNYSTKTRPASHANDLSFYCPIVYVSEIENMYRLACTEPANFMQCQFTTAVILSIPSEITKWNTLKNENNGRNIQMTLCSVTSGGQNSKQNLSAVQFIQLY
jgi:hypothetical protein